MIETVIEIRTVGVTAPPEDETTTMTVAMEIPPTGRIEEIDRGIGVGRETKMMAETTPGEAMIETIGAGEMIPATEHDDGGMILLTQNANPGGKIVGTVPRIRIRAPNLGRLVLRPVLRSLQTFIDTYVSPGLEDSYTGPCCPNRRGKESRTSS